EPMVTGDRYARVASRRTGGLVVVLDIAVPRDFDPGVHDGSQTFMLNIDDLKAMSEATLAGRRAHIRAAEQIVEQETQRFTKEWARRGKGPGGPQLTPGGGDRGGGGGNSGLFPRLGKPSGA